MQRNTPSNTTRRAEVISTRSTLEQIDALLPPNYQVTSIDGVLWIEGSDVAGWTLDDYVLPRLASRLHFAQEVLASTNRHQEGT
jgi:hypothetical protein